MQTTAPVSLSRTRLLHRWFRSHPESVGETYAEHAGIAGRFGATMMLGGMKCMVHALLPAVFERSASDCVKALNAEMTARRAATADQFPDYII